MPGGTEFEDRAGGAEFEDRAGGAEFEDRPGGTEFEDRLQRTNFFAQRAWMFFWFLSQYKTKEGESDAAI